MVASSHTNYGRTIGEFLCTPQRDRTVDRADGLSLADIKQDAALRTLRALHTLNKPIPADGIAAMNSEPALATHAFVLARHDALRKELGRGRTQRPRLVRSRFNLEGDALDRLGSVPDPSQSTALEAVEADAPHRLNALWSDGVPGVALDDVRRAIRVLQEIQMGKATGVERTPDRLRQQLHRLRRKTGLALDPRLL